MGCGGSAPRDGSGGGSRRMPGAIGEVAVFVPGIRLPKAAANLAQSLGGEVGSRAVERLSALRSKIVALAPRAAAAATTTARRKTAAARQHEGSLVVADLLQVLEDYLPFVLGLVKQDGQLKDKVLFAWVNQEDDAEETEAADAWYEVLSVLHLMAMLCLSQANLLLLSRASANGLQLRLTEEVRRTSVDVFLKAAGYLDCAIRCALPQISPENRSQLPVDLDERTLRALSLQSLGQAVDVQLGLAIDNSKATLAVKRRLACEMVEYWRQAQDSIAPLGFSVGWGKKHLQFVKWKYVEAKAAAYYFHGLILDEQSNDKSHEMAAASLKAAEVFLKESQRVHEVFHSTNPTSRSPPPSGLVKYLSEKILKDEPSMVWISPDFGDHERNAGDQVLLAPPPPLPVFALALKPDDYELPPLDPLWNKQGNQIQNHHHQ